MPDGGAGNKSRLVQSGADTQPCRSSLGISTIRCPHLRPLSACKEVFRAAWTALSHMPLPDECRNAEAVLPGC